MRSSNPFGRWPVDAGQRWARSLPDTAPVGAFELAELEMRVALQDRAVVDGVLEAQGRPPRARGGRWLLVPSGLFFALMVAGMLFPFFDAVTGPTSFQYSGLREGPLIREPSAVLELLPRFWIPGLLGIVVTGALMLGNRRIARDPVSGLNGGCMLIAALVTGVLTVIWSIGFGAPRMLLALLPVGAGFLLSAGVVVLWHRLNGPPDADAEDPRILGLAMTCLDEAVGPSFAGAGADPALRRDREGAIDVLVDRGLLGAAEGATARARAFGGLVTDADRLRSSADS